MPVFRLDERILFPPAELADPDGVIAVGGDLGPERLVLAYASGIFPWYSEELPIIWYSPDPRMILTPATLQVSRTLRKTLRRRPYSLRMDTAFAEVIEACKTSPRPGQDGTWITADMRKAYIELHRRGLAHSIEAWSGDELVGGLYGVSLGGVFFGESMFARAANASKVAFVALVRQLGAWGIGLIDCQVESEYLTRFGAHSVSRTEFLRALKEAIVKPTRPGPWRFDAGLVDRLQVV